MKTSPLCSRENGREIYFTAKIDGSKYRFTAPESMLDKTCGPDADEASRKGWVTDNKTMILDARNTGSESTAPFQNICVEEIT